MKILGMRIFEAGDDFPEDAIMLMPYFSLISDFGSGRPLGCLEDWKDNMVIVTNIGQSLNEATPDQEEPEPFPEVPEERLDKAMKGWTE